MASRRALALSLAFLAWSGISLPLNSCQAELPSTDVSYVDCALGDQGALTGQVVDPKGMPRAGDFIALFQGDEMLMKSKTDAQGRFSLPVPHGGIYDVATQGGCQTVRCWNRTAAPPHAIPAILVRDDGHTICGQDGEINPHRLKILTIAAVAISITALTLSVILPLVLQDDPDAS